MRYERWFRGSGNEEAAAFDWHQPASELDVPIEIARALYVRAMQRAADLGLKRAEQLYLRWLRDAAATRRRPAPAATPGRRTQVMREAEPRPRPELAALGPGKWTRALLEPAADDMSPPGFDDVQATIDALVAGAGRVTGAPGKTADAPARTANLREELLAAASRGSGVSQALSSVEPDAAAAMLRELKDVHVPGHSAPVLRLVARADDGDATRVLGRGSVGEPLPADLAARLGPHVGHEAAGAARVHTDDVADLIAAAHHARAVALGDAIYFARGQYQPGTEGGDELLAHELTHVAQAQRGELTRAAAKGLDTGGNLDRAEAEADLRAKLAVIEVKPPPTTVPAPAQPSGQPASTGERASKIAAQKQRLTTAGKAGQPDDTKVPAATQPKAPVPGTPPETGAAPAPAPTGNAYVDVFQAPPSKQATELWAKAGTDATKEATADQARFDAGLKPMPIVLDGGKPAGAKGGGTGNKPVKDPPPAGAAPPAAQPTPTPVPPPVTAAQAIAQNVQPNADKAAMKTEGKKVLESLPAKVPDTATDPGPAPVTDLAGQADPVRTMGDQQHAVDEGAKALDDAKAKIISGPGAAQVQPVKLDEKLTVPKQPAPGAMPQLPPVEGMDKFKKWNLPADAQASFDTVAKPKMDAHLADARSKMTQAETKRDADRTKAVDDANEKVKQAHTDADKQQQTKIADARSQISNHQADTLLKQEKEVQKLDKQSGEKKNATIAKIQGRIDQDQGKVDEDYKKAQKDAEDKKQKGDEDARKKKEEAEREAEEDKSWWEKAADVVCDAIKAVAEEIDKALDAICKAITDLIDAVKDAACKLIDAARDFVCAALDEFGNWLKSAVTALIGSVFPELAEALNRLIDQAVNAAKDAVNAIADGLKKAVTALCDSLKAAVEAAIAAFKAAVQAAATLAQALITGDWSLVAKMVLEGILKMLGIDPAAFYALIGKAMDSIDKIIENPGAFVGHLIDAVKLGFSQFGQNFWTHLKNGVVQWLFGTFAQAGITMPASFDVAGIFDLVCQVLGLTWPRMRGKVVKVIGEKNTERLEFVAKYLEALVTGGFAGLWEKVQQDMSGLWDMVIGGVRDWLMEKLVQQAIIKIATMWNPAGAIIQLIMTAWNVYQWVRENAQRIFGLVQAVVDSIANIVAGNIGGAANYIEASLAKLVPIAISLFANLLGLGGIADKIKSIIEKIQTKVDQAIDKLIARVMGMFKGKGDGKGDGADGDADKKDDKKDGQVGARITFQAHGETHTQYIDMSSGSPVPMVASTPSAVKSKIAEWRPRIKELPEADQKRAGKLIGKAIAIEGKVDELAGKVKAGTAQNTALEAKQRELADTLAELWEVMAPDLDPNKPFAEQDPRATLKSAQYAQFKSRFTALASDLDMPSGAAAAQDIWLKVVTALQKTDAAYKAAPTDSTSGRKDLSSDAFQKIMEDFEPITAALRPYMEKYAQGKKSWAFWSGKPAVEVAKKHSEVCLEKSALGSLFDGININGSWDIQMWASLSKAYATHAAASVGKAQYRGFVGAGSRAEQSIFNKIEQPQFVSMLSEKAKATLHVDWYAVAGDPKTDMKVPDWRFEAGGFDGVYGTGERGAMVALAESENQRRLELFKDKGIDEGPGGAGDSKAPALAPVVVTGDMKGESHKLTVDPAKGEIRLASVEGDALKKLDDAITAVGAMKAPEDNKTAAQGDLRAIRGMLQSLRGMVARRDKAASDKPDPSGVDLMKSKADDIMAALKAYGTKYNVKDIDVDLPSFNSEAEYEKLAKEAGTERVNLAIIAWQEQVSSAGFKEDAVEVWKDWTVSDRGAIAAPAVALLKDEAIKAKADGLEKIRPLFTSDSPTKRTFHRAAGDVAAAQAKQAGLAKVKKPESITEINNKTAYVADANYGKIETPKSKATVDPKLQNAVEAAGGIIGFMTGMATAKAAGGMSYAEFVTAWGDQTNVDYLKDRFRAVDPAKHEWIPSNLIADVIKRAHEPQHMVNAVGWVRLHNELRCETTHLIYAPGYATGTKSIGGVEHKVLCGHSGALYVETDKTIEPSTYNQNIWHNELRTAFDNATSISACITALEQKFATTIWNGKDALPADIYKKYMSSDGTQIDFSTLAATQATRYKAVEAVFGQVRKALASYG